MSLPDLAIAGRCPACGGQTLTFALGGRPGLLELYCAGVECPRPTALHEILTGYSQPDHIVDLRRGDYSVQHPMVERLDGVLLDACALEAWLHQLDGPPEPLGRYTVSQPDESDDWSTAMWTPVEAST